MVMNENVPWNDGGTMSSLGGATVGVMENGELETDPTDLTVGKNGFTVEAEPNRSGSLYGSGVPRKMKGLGDEGDAKNCSEKGSSAGAVAGSCLLGCSAPAKMSDLTLGVLPSGLSSGPGNRDWLEH